MSAEVIPRFRLVKCPICHSILPEPGGCDVYQCGGCRTDLKGFSCAKNDVADEEYDDVDCDVAVVLVTWHVTCLVFFLYRCVGRVKTEHDAWTVLVLPVPEAARAGAWTGGWP
ncbi:hypothetical protein TSUD_285470 [Trifolium subterraneum]|uniref:Enhanced disease resistance 4-like N-terminal domain-containing protein n=1 Tax=Trifolium subterraneum TaxID=3900 RepID=A0A2Z6P6K6_TRISU|nr:hypothetical protein TSUD_285470 [Trifolium subterraneum]